MLLVLVVNVLCLMLVIRFRFPVGFGCLGWLLIWFCVLLRWLFVTITVFLVFGLMLVSGCSLAVSLRSGLNLFGFGVCFCLVWCGYSC